MTQLLRGIAPETLLAQVKNTMPYLFLSDTEEAPLGPLQKLRPSRVLREYGRDPGRPLDHFQYFELCLCAHYLTVATPVPTDVDNQIRLRLWPAHLPLELALRMAQLVVESRHWDMTRLSNRFVFGAAGSARERDALTAHAGEWFTVAAGAYCALKRYGSPEARELREALHSEIADEVRLEGEVFASLWKAGDGLGCLKASVNLAHNLGDLDRVMDMWELAVDDPLRLEFYKLGIAPFDSNGKLRQLGRHWTAGELYKAEIDGSSMALENHRHFALRRPRALRQRPEFRLPLGPFYDDWGRLIGRTLASPDGSPSEDCLEVSHALEQGWRRLPRTLSYGRALRSLRETFPDLPLGELERDRSAVAVLETPQNRFERRWNEEALRHLDEIPSRAR